MWASLHLTVIDLPKYLFGLHSTLALVEGFVFRSLIDQKIDYTYSFKILLESTDLKVSGTLSFSIYAKFLKLFYLIFYQMAWVRSTVQPSNTLQERFFILDKTLRKNKSAANLTGACSWFSQANQSYFS